MALLLGEVSVEMLRKQMVQPTVLQSGACGPWLEHSRLQCVAEGHHQPSAGARSRQPEAAVPSSSTIQCMKYGKIQ